MVTYIRSDLDFILDQIKIAEAHAAGQPLYGPGGLIPSYNLSWGLRTVDGTYNNLLPGQSETGASDNPFPTLVDPEYVTIMVDPDGPGGMGPMPVSYQPGVDNDGPGLAEPSDVFDPYVRTISNLIVDQTLANPSAILTGLQRGGLVDPADEMAVLGTITAAYEAIEAEFLAVSQTRVAYFNAATTAAANPADAGLQQAAADALAAFDAATAALELVRGPLDALLEVYGIVLEGENIQITNVAPDEGLSAPFNSWFTLFGQFFDHGLDLVAKGGAGTVFIPLMPDDPLYVPGGTTNFMVLTRATLDENGQAINTTTAFVDQNQTYASHASHQVFLREYTSNVDGDTVNTGKLIEGSNSGMATWADLKEQASDLLGIWLRDQDVGNVPLLATDEYGNFIPGANGFPQVVFPGANPGDPPVLVEGNPAANGGLGISVEFAIKTGHAFLADIAHTAVPDGLEDGDITVGLENGGLSTDGFYDNELLDAHFIAGDGRVNENVGLTAVHHVFHSEHNRLVEHTKEVVLATGDAAFIAEWHLPDGSWDGERLFQAAKFGTEMQYQHLVFEEFARKIQPAINTFLVPDGYDVTIDASIVAEFAHVVYRFGHSMLTETIDRFDPTMTPDQISLIEGFLNPLEFMNNGGATTVDSDIAAGAIIRGMTRQEGNQIDEFVTSALRNNLLGLPLDLATINLARGRDTGVPSLNEARREFYEATQQNILLKPYESWVDFAGHLKNEASIINFIAAYGDHDLITSQTTIDAKRDAALTIITGVSVGGMVVPDDSLEFLNATGPYAGAVPGSLGGLENIDLWIGGLAEETMPFGGMLGSTFNFVFEIQMEKLQSGDRFYYLQRLDGLHLFSEMENNSFAALIMRNTDATHLPSDVFSTPGLILEVNKSQQFNDSNGDGIIDSEDPVGGGLLTPLVVRNNPATPGADTNYLKYTGDEHVVLGGTSGNDILVASIGDDTLHGDAGNDRMDGGFGNDILNGGDGDDIIVDAGGDDNIKAGDGNDVVHAGPGLDLVMGGAGQDFIFLGTDEGSEVFAGEGNDFIYGNRNAERILGNEGNDWIETGTFDGAPGDNFDEIFAHDGIDGHDVFLGDGGFDEFIGEGGDDIMVGSPGRGKMAGMSGYDWVTYKDNVFGVNADLSIPIIFDESPTLPQNAALDEFESMEGLSGSRFNDVLKGSNEDATTLLPMALGGSNGYLGSALDAQGIALISGLQAVLGAGVTSFAAGDIILGGDGNDLIQGNGGDDIIDGDKWLNVRIAVFAANDALHTEPPIAYHNSMTTLSAAMFAGAINPGQLGIVREIMTDETNLGAADPLRNIDTAVFRGNLSEYNFATTADGQIVVTHAIADGIDGTDHLRNIEQVQFADGTLSLIVGTSGDDTLNGTEGNDLILGLAGNDTLVGNGGNDVLVGGDGGDTLNGGLGNDVLIGGLNGPSGTFLDDFNGAASYTDNNGTLPFNGGWTESVGETTSPTGGDINIIDGRLRFQEGIDGGETITRAANLTGYTSATLSFDWQGDDLDGGETVTVQAFNGTTWDTLTTLGGDQTSSSSMALTVAQIGAHTAIRFVANGTFDGGENFFVDNFTLAVSNPDILNGGLGDDTYSFNVGDGVDIINEPVNAISGGTADRISIVSPSTIDPVTLETVSVLTGLNANDSNTGTSNGDLVINFNGQTVTVSGHYTGAVAGTGVERINFNGATYAGYLLGASDYLINRLDPANRDAGGVNLSASTVDNFVAGEQGVNDIITGGSGNDLIFGGTGDNDLRGGAGDDLLVGGSGAGDNDILDGGLDADTMVGLAGNDTYIVDDLADVVVEAAGGGTDEVETEMAELSIELMANVENLTYTGLDADPFVGTGNSLNNVITGGDLDDTLNGLAGNDTLNGGLGADILNGGNDNDTLNGGDDNDILNGELGVDTLNGGDGNDILDGGLGNDIMNGNDGDDTYFADSTVDDVNESGGQGTDHVQFTSATAGATYTIDDADVENLTLLGAANINGTGNASANVLTGNSGNNVLNGLGGNDTIDGGLGVDTIDGGTGNDVINYALVGGGADIINGGANTDRLNIQSGAAGDQTLNVIVAAGVITAVVGGPASITGIEQYSANLNGGTDTLSYAGTLAAQSIAVNLTTNSATGFTSIENIENVTGGSGNDTFVGSTAANILIGGLGNDTFNYIIGGGADTIDGGIGTDVLNITGLNNNDTLDVIYAGTVITMVEGGAITGVETINANLGGNADTLSYAGSITGVTVNLGAGTASGFNSIASIRDVVGGSGNDTLTANGGANVLDGGAGVDTINGGAGGDTLIGGAGADIINTGAADDNVQDILRFSSAADFGDTVSNFDANGADAQDDRVEFGDALNTAWDDGNSNDNFLFASGNGVGGIVNVTVGQGAGDIEALLLTGVGGEGVTTADLGNASLVSLAFNTEFGITAANGEDALLVINDTNGNSFSLWQWVQAGGGETAAAELTHIATLTGNATVTAGNFDFFA